MGCGQGRQRVYTVAMNAAKIREHLQQPSLTLADVEALCHKALGVAGRIMENCKFGMILDDYLLPDDHPEVVALKEKNARKEEKLLHAFRNAAVAPVTTKRKGRGGRGTGGRGKNKRARASVPRAEVQASSDEDLDDEDLDDEGHEASQDEGGHLAGEEAESNDQKGCRWQTRAKIAYEKAGIEWPEVSQAFCPGVYAGNSHFGSLKPRSKFIVNYWDQVDPVCDDYEGAEISLDLSFLELPESSSAGLLYSLGLQAANVQPHVTLPSDIERSVHVERWHCSLGLDLYFCSLVLWPVSRSAAQEPELGSSPRT